MRDEEGAQFGATFAARVEPRDGLEFATNLTVAHNDLRGVGPLSIIPKYYGNARVEYQLGGDGPTFGVVGRFSGRRVATTYIDDGGYEPDPPSAGMLGEFRLIGSGPLAEVAGLQWRTLVNVALSGRQPYMASDGPLDEYPENTQAFISNARLFALIGVHYDRL